MTFYSAALMTSDIHSLNVTRSRLRLQIVQLSIVFECWGSPRSEANFWGQSGQVVIADFVLAIEPG